MVIGVKCFGLERIDQAHLIDKRKAFNGTGEAPVGCVYARVDVTYPYPSAGQSFLPELMRPHGSNARRDR